MPNLSPSPKALWRNRIFEATAGASYDYAVNNPWMAAPGGRLLWSTDVELLYRAMDVVNDAPEGSAILDVPCGGGVALSRLRPDRQVRYVAADISATMLGRAERNARGRGLTTIEFVETDIAAMPFADDEFDVVLCFNGLHCLPAPDRAVAEMARVLRGEGRLVGDFVARRQHWRGDRVAAAMRAGGVFGPSGTVDQARGWFAAAGLTLQRLEPSGSVVHFEAVKR